MTANKYFTKRSVYKASKKHTVHKELTIRTLGLEGQFILQGWADAHLVLSKDSEEVSHILQQTFHRGGRLIS